MKRKIKVVLSGFIMSMVITSCGSGESNKATVKAVDKNNMDLSIKPGDNFYQYANGGWIKNNPVPSDRTQYGSFSVLYDQNQIKLKNLVLDAAKSKSAKGTIAQKIGDFYNSGMDTVAIDKLGIKPIEKDLARVDALKSHDQLLPLIAEMQKTGVHPVFYFFGAQDDQNSEMIIANLYQGGLGLPDRDYYLSDDARSQEIRKEYISFIKKIFVLAGYTEENAENTAVSIMKFETRLAKASFTRLENRDPYSTYNKMSVAELEKITPEANWNKYFTSLGLNNPGDINVKQVKFFKEASNMLKTENIQTWKNYLKWNILNSSASSLSSDFGTANFEFYGTVLSGQKIQSPRWKRVLGRTSGSMGEAIGKLYVEKFFPPEAKERMIKLVANLKASLGHRIDKLDWMSDETKVLAHEKLDAINVKVGYPDKWMDYTNLDIEPGKWFENVKNARIFSFNDGLSKIGKPYDKSEWGMTPQTVNAYYSPNANEIVFPAAILQPPFFYMDQDDAVNYGAIGVVIGHEMTHGFDDQGRNYDKKGNLNNWWSDEDASAFNANW